MMKNLKIILIMEKIKIYRKKNFFSKTKIYGEGIAFRICKTMMIHLLILKKIFPIIIIMIIIITKIITNLV